MADLSKDAQVVLHGTWPYDSRHTLNGNSNFTDRMRRGLDELVDAGLLKCWTEHYLGRKNSGAIVFGSASEAELHMNTLRFFGVEEGISVRSQRLYQPTPAGYEVIDAGRGEREALLRKHGNFCAVEDDDA